MSSVNQVNQGSSIQVPVGTEVKQPQAKSYLLNQPIKDTVSFSGTPETEDKKSGGALKWILGLGALATAAFFTYRHFNPKTIEKVAENLTTPAEDLISTSPPLKYVEGHPDKVILEDGSVVGNKRIVQDGDKTYAVTRYPHWQIPGSGD